MIQYSLVSHWSAIKVKIQAYCSCDRYLSSNEWKFYSGKLTFITVLNAT